MGMGAAYQSVQQQFRQGQRVPLNDPQNEAPAGLSLQPDVPPGGPSLNDIVTKYTTASATGAPAPAPASAPAAEPKEEGDAVVDERRQEEDQVRAIDAAFGAVELTDAEKKLPVTELRKRMHAKYRMAWDDDDMDPSLRANIMYGSAERRFLIDQRCAPVEIDEMLLTGTCKQEIPVNPDTGFMLVVRTLNTAEDSYITRKLAEVAAQASRMEFQQYVSRYEMAFGVLKIKSITYTDPTNVREDGSVEVDEEKLAKKLIEVDRIPSPLFLELYSQYQWFKHRVRNAIALFDLGNS